MTVRAAAQELQQEPIVTGEVSAVDPVLHEELVRPWDLCVNPLEAREFDYSMEYLKIPGVTLYKERFNLRCKLQGASPENTFVIAIPIAESDYSTYWGSTITGSSSVPVMLPGALDVELERGHEQLIVLIDLIELYCLLPPETIGRLEVCAASNRIPAGKRGICFLRSYLCEILNSAKYLAESTDQIASSKTIRENITQQLIDALDLTKHRIRPPVSLREKGLQRVLTYLRESDTLTPSIPDLSREAGVSQRTLEYAFQEKLGMTPLAFLRLRRMHAARLDLSRSCTGNKTVTQIAQDHGFYHPARFSLSYRQLFGENPSATLMRNIDHPRQEKSPLI